MEYKEFFPYFIEREGKRFYYIDFGSEEHGRTSFRLWISSALLVAEALAQGKTVVQFPCDAIIIKTNRGNYVLKPSSEHLTVDIFIQCGFRGSSSIKFEKEPLMKLEYRIFSSPLGATGVSKGVLATFLKSELPVYFTWSKTGRLYGSPPSGRCIITKDGEVKEAPPLDDELEEL